ncbi:disease resistance protein At4g27190-like [Castanea sativa]|uniref:disease resistance protein At4g27190-like n=1 Tax=Castanea sativa TaxID=21020 RepID=UPI003F65134F
MEVLTETVKVVVEKIVDYTITAVGRQMGYLIRYKKNVVNLSNEVDELNDARDGVQRKVQAASDNVEEIEANVQRWLTRVQGINTEVQEFLEEEGQAKLKCFNLKARYQIGRKAHKMGLAVKELKDKAATFQTVGHRVPIQGGTTISTKGYEDFESRKLTLNGIMKALKDDSIRAIGVYGMGGVGKTMLVGKVATLAKKDKLFESIVTVVVSQTPDLEKIQKDIAKELGLNFQDETDSQKADLLSERLKKEKILLIIDDIWNKIDLESRGISFGDDQKGSKLLLTSRFRDVLGTDIDTQEIFSVGALSDDEAKHLFSKIVGNFFAETLDFQSTMVEVVKECAGLPIAITTVANAMKSRKDPKIWKDAVGQLKRANPTQIKEMHEKVYSSIKLSYDFLTKEAQSLFLLCSIFEEDKVIEIDFLWRYLVGLDFFEDVYKMEEVRNRVHTLVNSLKDSCLLLEGNGSGTLKMHDVIRDVAIYIADKEEKMLTIRSLEGPEKWLNMKKWEDSFGIAHFDVDFKVLPERFRCPQLKFIFLGSTNKYSSQPIPNNVFEGMKELRVLVLIGARLPHPSSISCLHNLQSLVLHRCELEDVALIGELKNLRALTLSYSNIKQLPMEIRQLTHLQLLDLNYCTELEVIPSNVFSDLRGLEELYLERSFNRWHIDGEITERSNTRVSELDYLPLLTTLYINIPNPKVLPKALLFEKLKRYEILIGRCPYWYSYSNSEYYKSEISRTLILQLDRGLQIEDGIKVLLKSCEYLDLTPWEGIKNILYEVDKKGFPQLKHLRVGNSTEIQYIVNLMENQCVAFPVLQSLTLYNMENLEEICHDQVLKGSFLSLKKLKVWECKKLTSVFSLTMFGCFSQLQEIVIADCEVMCAIFSKERTHEIQVNHDIRTDIIHFTQLRSLRLRNLPNLMGFHPDADSLLLFNDKVAFSNLEDIYIKGIDNLKKLWHNHQLVLDSFCKIKNLHVGRCKNLMNIFPPNMLRRLQNLEELEIEYCNSVEEVFEVREENVDEICDKVCIQLRYLTLNNLPKLKHVWTMDPKAILTFQNLRQVKVSKCETLKSLFPVSVAKSLEQLESLDMDDCGLMEEIVALEEELETTKFVFPRITSLSLQLLPELKCFYRGKHTSEWPSLRSLTIHKCDKVKIGASNELSFPDTDGLGHHVPIQQHLFLIEKDTFPNLEVLDLDWYETMNQTNGRLFGEFFCKLKVLRLHSKDDKLIAGPSVFVDGLRYLKSLSVANLFFDNEGQYAGTFERLTKLKLFRMPRLMLLWKENSEQGRAFQNLKILEVSKCNRLINLVPSSMHFRNLNTLKVRKCHGLISLATSSAVKSLVQLKNLTIYKCKRMREIVTNEGEGEARDEICFNQLEFLSLDDLPSLRSFHLGNRTIKFPSLKFLTVTRCPEMKIFSNGVLSMPKLDQVKPGKLRSYWRRLLPEEDLNSAIKRNWEENYDMCVQQLFTEKFESHKREDDDDDDEDEDEDER